jgi:hypothetical protein
MRIVASLWALVFAVVAAALLGACGGNSAIVPVDAVPTSTGVPFTEPTAPGNEPTPVVPASPISVPTPTVSSSPVTGLPSASPAAAAAKHRRS